MAELTELATDAGAVAHDRGRSPRTPRACGRPCATLGLDGAHEHVRGARAEGARRLRAQRFAVIDVGTNSVKFHVAERGADGAWRTVADRAEVTRLGEGLDRTGGLSAAADRAHGRRRSPAWSTRRAPRRRRDRGGRHRGAADRGQLRGDSSTPCRRAPACASRSSAGRRGGAARLPRARPVGARAELRHARRVRHRRRQLAVHVRRRRPGRRALQRRRRRRALHRALRARRGGLGGHARTWRSATIANELARLGRPAGAATRSSGWAAPSRTWPRSSTGWSSTTRTWSRARCSTAREIDRQIELYRTRDADERRAIAGLQPNRADVILAGACIVRTVLDALGADALTVSDRGLRHGLLAERFARP